MDPVKIILELKRPVDYKEYQALCEKRRIKPLPLLSYSHTMGMMLIGMYQYPDIPPYDAFIRVQQEANQAMGQGGCSSCGDNKDKPLPPLLTQAKNLVAEVGKHVSDGLKNVDDKTLEFRNKICNDCEEMRSDGRCSKCGCFMKVKAKWESAKCPTGKW